MRSALVSLAGLALLAAGAASAESRQARDGEARLARMLGERVAGQPVGCIDTTNNAYDLIVIDGVGVVYDAGDTLYLARLADPAQLRPTDRIAFHRASSRELCTSDEVWPVDRRTNLPTGAETTLEAFVPYTRRG